MRARLNVVIQKQSLVLGLVLVCLAGFAYGDIPNDHYIMGYATAILEQQFKVQAGSLQVKDGVIIVRAEDLGAADREKIVSALKEIRGVVRVDVIEVPEANPPPAKPEAAAVGLGDTKPRGGEFLPEGRLFEPLIADPHWPHFSIAYQRYLRDKELRNVGATSLGTTIAVYEDDFAGGGRWQGGVQGAVFAIFDLDASSSDLINADYWLGVPFS